MYSNFGRTNLGPLLFTTIHRAGQTPDYWLCFLLPYVASKTGTLGNSACYRPAWNTVHRGNSNTRLSGPIRTFWDNWIASPQPPIPDLLPFFSFFFFLFLGLVRELRRVVSCTLVLSETCSQYHLKFADVKDFYLPLALLLTTTSRSVECTYVAHTWNVVDSFPVTCGAHRCTNGDDSMLTLGYSREHTTLVSGQQAVRS